MTRKEDVKIYTIIGVGHIKCKVYNIKKDIQIKLRKDIEGKRRCISIEGIGRSCILYIIKITDTVTTQSKITNQKEDHTKYKKRMKKDTDYLKLTYDL